MSDTPSRVSPSATDETQDYRALILSFIASLTLADHMGDVSDDVSTVLQRIGLDVEWDEFSELGSALGKMGIKTLYETSLGSDDDE